MLNLNLEISGKIKSKTAPENYFENLQILNNSLFSPGPDTPAKQGQPTLLPAGERASDGEKKKGKTG
jgi:hypothetical protein